MNTTQPKDHITWNSPRHGKLTIHRHWIDDDRTIINRSALMSGRKRWRFNRDSGEWDQYTKEDEKE